jgi:hypothetical protein
VLLYILLYLLSLAGLANIHFLNLIKRLFVREPKTEDERLAAEQKAMAKEAKDLARQTKQLEEQAAREAKAKGTKPAKASPNPVSAVAPEPDKPTLGPDLKPVPEPKFQDNSQPKPPADSTPAGDGLIVSGKEIAAATPTNAILGANPCSSPPSPPKPTTTGSPDRMSPLPMPPSGKQTAKTPSPRQRKRRMSCPWFRRRARPFPAATSCVARCSPRKPRPITVASTPIIDGYCLPGARPAEPARPHGQIHRDQGGLPGQFTG